MTREETIIEHVGLARKLARSYAARSGLRYDEATSVGYEALVRAVDSFDPADGRTLKGWISVKIWWELQDFSRDLDPNARAARKAFREDKRYFVRRANGVLVEVLPVTVGELRADIYGSGVHLDDSVCQRLDLVRGLRHLRKQERYVLLRAMAGYRQDETAIELQLTESRVSQIKTKAAKKLALLIAA